MLRSRACASREFARRTAFVHLYFSFIAEDKRMCSRVLKSVSWAVALAFVALLPVAVSAQADSFDRQGRTWRFPVQVGHLRGYSYLAPHGTVTNSPTTGWRQLRASYNAVNCRRHLRALPITSTATLAFRANWESMSVDDEVSGPTSAPHGNDDGFLTVAGGLIARFPMGISPHSLHGLVGGAWWMALITSPTSGARI